jgi:polyisoprenoid-binding protein YceI
VNTASVFTNNAERDKHISSKDFLKVADFPKATFVSTSVKTTGKNADGKVTADVAGDLTIAGVTKPVVVKATFLGEGKDPWGGYRAGFEGTTSIKRSDFGKMMDLGPQSDAVDLYVTFEGVKAK